MNNTLGVGDVVLIKKSFNDLKTGDIVYYQYPLKDSTIPKTLCIQRLIGLPGDTIELSAKEILLNNFSISDTSTVKHNYYIKANDKKLDSVFKLKYNLIEGGSISNDLDYSFSLTKSEMEELKRADAIEKVEIKSENKGVLDRNAFPYSNHYSWNMDNYGKLYLPKQNDTLLLDSINIDLYTTIIKDHEKNDLEIRNDSILIDNVLTKKYVVKQNYYFVIGDNRDNSNDSRVFGFLPERYIKGKVIKLLSKKK